jgi:hypothetical protein
MKVYVVTEIYFSEEGVHKEVKCVCKDKNTARDKMKELVNKQIKEQFEYEDWTITTIKDDECVLDSTYESLVLKINKWEVI